MLPDKQNDNLLSYCKLYFGFCYEIIEQFILVKAIRMGSKQSKVPPEEETSFAFKQMIRKMTITDPHIYYQFCQLLGEGCCSQVFKVKSISTGQFRALKKMQKGKNVKISRHLSNQFQILRQMDHPNIVKIYQTFEDQTHYYIVTEYLQGKDVLQLLQKSKVISEDLAFSIFYQLILAVNYIHSNKFMHRDIKLENIIYNQKTALLKLIDFGSALKYQQNVPRQRRCTGTIHYLAPQVINKYYNNKCDIWSLGILLYVLLSGNAPFFAKQHQTILNKILNDSLTFTNPIWQTRSSESKNLITKMLEKNFQKRISIGLILKDPWILKFRQRDIIYKPERQLIVSSLQYMQKFTKITINDIQRGILVFMINAVIKPGSQTWLSKVFNRIDQKEDGQLDLDQIKNALTSYLGLNTKKAEMVAQSFIAKIDIDFSGFINFTQFVVSAMNLGQVLTKQNINKTFDFIDTDKSGALSINELRTRLGEHIEQQYYSRLIKHFDKDGDGQISKKQFEIMMRTIITNY